MKAVRSLSSNLQTAADDVKNKNETKLIETEFKQSPIQFQQAINNIGFSSVAHKLSANDTLGLKTMLNANTETMRKMHSFLLSFNLDILASVKSVRKEVQRIIHETETGKKNIYKNSYNWQRLKQKNKN